MISKCPCQNRIPANAVVIVLPCMSGILADTKLTISILHRIFKIMTFVTNFRTEQSIEFIPIRRRVVIFCFVPCSSLKEESTPLCFTGSGLYYPVYFVSVKHTRVHLE